MLAANMPSYRPTSSVLFRSQSSNVRAELYSRTIADRGPVILVLRTHALCRNYYILGLLTFLCIVSPTPECELNFIFISLLRQP